MNLDKYEGWTAERVGLELETAVNTLATNQLNETDKARIEQVIKELVIVGTLINLYKRAQN